MLRTLTVLLLALSSASALSPLRPSIASFRTPAQALAGGRPTQPGRLELRGGGEVAVDAKTALKVTGYTLGVWSAIFTVQDFGLKWPDLTLTMHDTLEDCHFGQPSSPISKMALRFFGYAIGLCGATQVAIAEKGSAMLMDDVCLFNVIGWAYAVGLHFFHKQPTFTNSGMATCALLAILNALPLA
eukprot:CAMPEP_0206235858 /NCGR_PEP_ID=MMETSP0047_2-20121206/13390_1 /ASSEMBLY_ACC=CAM_ASM_000192 /TAXON_ID=195065 /ORGANISM="Chroomonas mesostigmatica_cf, Strain CCMP1168" /LENGTH=185 /DNA_ID=CAMNT_0053660123 /DNA_START=43 /DNA_END=600 /DNA_ORIENTATION=+